MPSCSSEFTPRWTGDFAALVVTTRDTINDWEFRNGIYVADHYDDGVLKPIYLHMERPNSTGSGSPQLLHLLACRKVPVGAAQVCGAGHMATQHLHMTHRNTNSLQRQAPRKSSINSRKPPESSLSQVNSHLIRARDHAWPPFVHQVMVPNKFQPRRGQPGITLDPRGRQIWQEKENGACSWDVAGTSFHQARGLGAQAVCISLMSFQSGLLCNFRITLTSRHFLHSMSFHVIAI